MFSRPEFKGVNFLHFKELLLEEQNISISYSSLISILKNAGYETPKKKKIRHRTHRRKRKNHPGQLVQIDATPYEWFQNGKKYALHGAIDDATGNVVGLYMTQNECLFGYLEMMRQCCLDFGVPQTLYSDRHTIFRSPKTDSLSIDEIIAGKEVKLTQFGRAVNELGIDIIYAKTPQAKGRIERLWNTLQSRLPVELKRRGITTLDQANEFLLQYRHIYNTKFSVAAEGESLFVPVVSGLPIDEILCVKHKRKTDNAGSFSFKNRCFQILDEGFPVISSRREIEVLINPRFGIKVAYHGKSYEVIRYLRPQRKDTDATKVVPKKTTDAVTPHLIHSSDAWRKIWWSESYDLSLKFLYELFFEKQQSSVS